MSDYLDALYNAPIGSTISASGETGGSSNPTIDESTSQYELIGDQEPLDTPAEAAALDDNNGSSGADTSGGGFSVPEEFRENENYGETSTGSNGGSESPPDNGGYTNPPSPPDRTGSGSSSAGNDPVSDGGFFSDLPTLGDIQEGLDISDNPNISSDFGGGGGSLFGDIQEGLDISDNPNISSDFGGGGGSLFGGDSIISNITGGGGGDGGGTDSSDVGGFSVPPIFREDENYSGPDPDDPAIDGGPQWFTIGLAAVAALGAGLLIAGRD